MNIRSIAWLTRWIPATSSCAAWPRTGGPAASRDSRRPRDFPAEVFSAVAGETGHVLDAETTAVARFEADGTATVAGSWAKPGTRGLALPVGSSWLAEENTVAARVQRTGEPARVSSYDSEGGSASAWARERGIRSSAGGPIIVEGRPSGMITAFFGTAAPHPGQP